MFQSRRDLLIVILTGIFVCNAIVAEVISGKLFTVGPFTMTVGVLLWPFVFLTTDVVNEYFGSQGVRRLTLITTALIGYAFVILFGAIRVPAAGFSPVNDDTFAIVFGQSMWIIVGSMAAFALSQLVDVFAFWAFRHATGGRHIWLRATGSTVLSQLIDSFVVIGIGFWLPGTLGFTDFLVVAATGYGYKLLIAVVLTPFIYGSHFVVERFLGSELARELVDHAAATSGSPGRKPAA